MGGIKGAVTIPFVDLTAQYRQIQDQIDSAIRAVVERSAFSEGTERAEFEAAFASYVGTAHCVGVSSGTDALELSLRAVGVGPGDEVITAANTFFATCEAISLVGAQVRFVDVDPETYNIDPDLVEGAITAKTKAIIPVHLYGQAADMDRVLEIAKRRGIKVIEDAAQAHGAQWRTRRVGSFGVAACFSFYPSKNLGAYGDAGAVVTNDPAIAQSVRMLSNHGQRERYIHDVIGSCHRLDNIQAAVLGVKLRHLESWNAARRRVARLYDQLLSDVKGVITPRVATGAEHVYHLYVVRVGNRDEVRKKLTERGIGTGIHYPIPCHEQPAYSYLDLSPQDYPVSSQAARQVLSLPMYAELGDEEIRTVVDALRAAVDG